MMKRFTLRQLVFMALCCDLGLFAKRLIGPASNLITDFLHIPGGVGTAFSLMFLIIAAVVCDTAGSATVMAVLQSGIALSLGMIGSMGALSPIGYIVPGVIIDLTLLFGKRLKLSVGERMTFANAFAGGAASLTANLIVFRLTGPPLWLYLAVATTSGALCGLVGEQIVKRVNPYIQGSVKKGETKE